MRTSTTLTILALSLSLGLTGCARNDQEEAASTPSPRASATTEAPSAPPVYVTPEAAPTPADPNRSPTSLVPADADEAATQGAGEAAMRTAKVWIRGTTMDQNEWNTALLETLAPIARSAYDDAFWAYQVEDTVILGAPTINDPTMLTAEVVIPTDAGELHLTVTRDDENAPWQTTAIQ